MLSATFPLNVRIILSDPFSGRSSSYVVCVYNHFRRMNQNRLTMGLTSHLYCLSDALSSYHVSFNLIYLNWCHLTNYISSTMSLTMMGMDPGLLVRALFYFTLANTLVLLENPLVVSVA